MLFVFDDAVQLSHAVGSLKIKYWSRRFPNRNALVCQKKDTCIRKYKICVNLSGCILFHSHLPYTVRFKLTLLWLFFFVNCWEREKNNKKKTIMSPTPTENGIHTPKELELMAKLKSLEEDRVKFVEIVRNKVKKLETELDVSMRTVTFFSFCNQEI